MNIIKLVLPIIGCFILYQSCNNSSQTQDIPVAEADVFAEAKEIYSAVCSGCHGMEVGAFADRKTWKFGDSKDSIAYVIKTGILEDGMPSFDSTYSADQISLLADYIVDAKDNVAKYRNADPIESDTFMSEELTYRIDTVVSGLNSPWGMAFLPNGDLLVTDKSGELYRVNAAGKKTEIKGVPEVRYKGQGGLLDVELHPDFENNQWVYLSHAITKEDDESMGSTAISRGQLKGNALVNVERIFEAVPYFETGHHYGSRISFGNDGKMYFSIGDRGKRDENPQSLERDQGKIHRLNDDGSIPSDNPFVNQDNAKASIYSYGHRNPQGIAVHPQTGAIWTTEHGPRGGDEINISLPGKNFGWPVISYGINYNGTIFTDINTKEGMMQPLHYWVPSIAPCGMDFVVGDRYPGWENNLLVGSLKYKYLDRVVLDGDKIVHEEPLIKGLGRVRSVKMSPDNYIYVGLENPGFVVKLIPITK